MATLSYEQIYALALKHGFTGENTAIAAAVAMAESRGNTRAHNATPPDDSYGLWQINMYKGLGPARRRQFGLQSNSDLYDPDINAKAAYAIYKGSGWKAWTTYTRGDYKSFMRGGSASSTTPNAETESIPKEDTTGWNIGSAVNALGATFMKGTANVAGVVIAVVLLALGVVLLMRNVVPIGKIARKVTG